MKSVSRFEANLLRILQFFLRRVPLEQARPLLAGRWPQPECLSRDAVDLIQDHLAKGCTLLLARMGGWRRERHQRGDQVVEGRLWERTPPADLGLSFSRHTLRFLIWITAHHAGPAEEKPTWTAPEAELLPGDWLLFFFAYSALRETEFAPVMRPRPGFASSVLCRLAFPEDFPLTPCPSPPRGEGSNIDPARSLGERGRGEGEAWAPPDFRVWTSGPGTTILEALQPELAECWVRSERSKGRITDWATLRGHSLGQEQTLEAFLQAVESSGRLDLARFLLQAAAQLLTPEATAPMWVHAEAGTGVRLADRMETYRAALALVNRVERFRRWEQRARSVGYMDEGYPVSQLVKSEWERWGGEAMAVRAQRIVRELDPMSLPNEGRT